MKRPKALSKNTLNWIVASIIMLIGAVAFFGIKESHRASDLERRKLELEYVHKRAVNQFNNSIDKFAGIVAGMRSYMNLSVELPTEKAFQEFIKNQLNDLNYRDSIVVSYVDTNHIFKYSFTKNTIDPANLVGKSVESLRDEVEINRLNDLMKSDSITLFKPINLIEGWNGIPLNFRVHRDNQTLGYVAPIINFKAVMQSIYDDKTKDEFVFRFSTSDGIDFDRESVYDGSKIYHNNADPEYYKLFGTDTANFLYSDNNYYGLSIRIGSAYKQTYKSDGKFEKILFLWFVTFVFFVGLITKQIIKQKVLNNELNVSNDLLEKEQEQVSEQNIELKQLNLSKNKLFSIIGHDLKGPLNSIQNLLQLLNYEEINDETLKTVIHKLELSTSNTVNLLDNLLRWARSQTNETRFRPEQLMLNDVLQEVIEAIQVQATHKHIELTTHLEDNLEVNADANMLKTVIRNLISNAVKFTFDGGKIDIFTASNYDQILITIKDNGIGMSQATINNLFSLDKHLSTRGTNGEMGTALGILLCQEFIKKHNGKIEIESKLEQGSSFTIVLPK